MRVSAHRRGVAAALSVMLAVTVAPAVPQTVAAADPGPSVPLPGTPSVPVSEQAMGSRPADEATTRALRGDQPAGSAPKEGGGTSSATSLAPSATWNVSAQTGDFSWSYPLRVPPAAGGLEPQLALSYTSSAVDGRTSATNNQASWIGDGWDLSAGFVERSYGGCPDDKEGGTTPPQVGDLCWKSDNATASYDSGGGQLILGAGGWRAKIDDGSRIERFTGSGNGDDNGESWKITTVDGKQYFFGSRPGAKSTWTVPVFGDDAGEPCHGASFDASSCSQAWRWNLDKVVDRHGNTMLFDYETETNNYGRNLKDAAVSYVRGGWLSRIDYGLHGGVAAQASGRVVFGTAERCVPGSVCTFDKKDNFPDVPLTDRCDTATCKDRYSPTFWTTKRLATITAQVLRNGSYADVDRWTLDQQFPDPGDGEKAALWLKSITHTGLAGGTPITMPPVTFEGAKLANRVHQADGLAPIIRYRITGIVSESGGVTSINYAPPDCLTAPTNPESNTKRCFPVWWKKRNFAERMDYFNKYVVASVIQSDRIGANPQEETHYEYLDGAAWHYDQSEFTPADKKTWNEFRGFGRVRIRKGAAYDPAGPITMTEHRFYRGMHGDRLNPQGGTKTVQVTDSERGAHLDHDWLEGFGLETITYLGESETVVSKTITDPVWQGPTATRGPYNAYIVGAGTVRGLTALDGGRGWRVTKTTTTYDDRGQPIQVDDLGNVATATDDICSRTTYIRNTERWLINLPSRMEKVAVNCGTTPVYPRDAISDVRSSFDGLAYGAAPTTGSVTRLEQLTERPASGPVYKTVSTARYDIHGRVIESGNALGKVTEVSFTPDAGGPTTQTLVTNALGHTATSVLDPAFGQPTTVIDANGKKTESAYDALGRITEMWLPNRPRTGSSPQTPNYRFTYQVRNDAPTVVTTSTIGPTGRYTGGTALYDGLLRTRQIQVPAVGGGRLISDTRYDSQGRVAKITQQYFNDQPVDAKLSVANDNEIPGLTVNEYDGAGRQVESIYKGGGDGSELWRTSTRYGGDRTHVDPPEGGTASTSLTDARGQVTELRHYHGPGASGTYDATKYEYTPAGQLAMMSDPAGNRWEYRYDLRGRPVWTKDPDKGIGTSTYDDLGQLLTHTDARNLTTVHSYDDLGRKTADHIGSLSGPRRAAWTYDTLPNGLVAKGMRATSTSYDADGKAYTTQLLGYNALYKPLKVAVVVPELPGEASLAGTYTFTSKYNADGSLASEIHAAAGGLPEEAVSHTYDDFGRPLRTYGGPVGSTTEYALNTEYTRYGETQRLHLGEGDKQVWLSSYYDDSTRRLSRTIVDAELSRPMVADVNYRYDPAGNVTSIADTTLNQQADVQCFRYDHLRRLTEAWTPGNGCQVEPSTAGLAGPAPYWQSWTYDPVGNRRTETQHASGGDTTRTYGYPAPGQARPHAVSTMTTSGPGGSQTESYGYDASGNTITRGAQRLDWDSAGRLSKVVTGGRTTEAVYDGDGERLIRRDPTSTTLYLGSQEVRLDRATGRLTGTRYYKHGGRTIAVRTAAGLSWLAGDHQNTQQIAIDAQAQTVTRRRQLPFGGPRGAVPAFSGEKGFVGGTVDASTGLIQLGARPYDAGGGRFLSVDPIVNPSDSQQMHGYAYADNNPVTFSDPTGLYCDSCNFYAHTKGEASVWAPGVPTRPRIEGERSANKHARDAERATMKKPVLVRGKTISRGELQFLRSQKGYRGSDDFSLEDVLQWSTEGDIQAIEACFYLGGSAAECDPPAESAGKLNWGVLYEFVPVVPDVHHCLDGTESCWWILSNIGPGKVGKLFVKGADAVSSGAKVAARGADEVMSPETRRLAEANVTDSGDTVLGHFPGYIDKAKARGASYYDIGDHWDKISDAERKAANKHFLDVIAARGDRVVLSLPKQQIRKGSWLEWEVAYLQSKGYKWVNQWSLQK